jgi:hypothetical protein
MPGVNTHLVKNERARVDKLRERLFSPDLAAENNSADYSINVPGPPGKKGSHIAKIRK